MQLQEAKALALQLASPGKSEAIALRDALGRVLAESVESDRSIPGEARSRWDGFALRSSDTLDASPANPISLKILPGMLAAGHSTEEDVLPGYCLRIFTGAPLPAGADAVVRQEDVVETGNQLVLKHPCDAGSGVTAPGVEILKGQCLLPMGAILTPTRCALLAGLGKGTVLVYRRPRVALLATGDEVRELGEPSEGPFTFCNNRYLLEWLVMSHGGVPLVLGCVEDHPGHIAGRLRDVDADMVITTGGMGRGRRDFILEVWQELGVHLHFSRIALSPGKNSALGSSQNRLFWGLPGNPWGAQLVFQELVAPVLLRMGGHVEGKAPGLRAILQAPVKRKQEGTLAIRGMLNLETLPPAFLPQSKKSGPLYEELRNSFAYILLEAHVQELAKGSEVQTYLHDLPLSAHPILGRNVSVALCISPAHPIP
ncbi:molybdopterin molybdotransferase MoeA [Desulforhabdus sp. TSK]|uniref:molybdopterin molybdotransferase MoeA n=1 Tax=Desulforhabdus sp. TSK TaxID=2925014 RepID=UPI001FC8B3C1|nr:molybdopterin molybdotransferase MoeA [Desulforhabdus sp. TSK]GKT07909.1 molybdopterin molybdenumtransferase MoeA [Desulforhabdus sp. TSK]